MTGLSGEALARAVRAYAVVNLRTGRVHGMTCNVNQSGAWVRELIEKYRDPLAATQCVDLVDPDEQNIPIGDPTVTTTPDTDRPTTAASRPKLHGYLNEVNVHGPDLTGMELTLDYMLRLDRAVLADLPDTVWATGSDALTAVRAAREAVEAFRTACHAALNVPCIHRATDTTVHGTATVRRLTDNTLWTHLSHNNLWVTADAKEGPYTWAALLTTGDVVTVPA